MKYFCLIFLCIITTSITAQYYNDSISWALSSNDSVSSSTWILRGLKQNLGNDIPAPKYNNGYQKIIKPTAGWPPIPNVNSRNSFIEFPFGTQPDVCYDTTGGGRFCLGYNYFSPEVIQLTGYVPQVADSAIMDVYFYDTSCYAAYYGDNYKYLGNIIIKSDNSIQPTNINFRIDQENNNRHFEVCGVGGKYSALRLYPRTGGDLFIKNMTIIGSSIIMLPIHFTYLRASPKNETIVLYWKIENMQDLQKFIIEKSADGRLFTDATTPDDPGNMNATGAYSWIDKSPFENNNFYRIKAFEKTGKVSVSEVVRVKSPIKQEKIKIYPNPVANKLLKLVMKNISISKYLLTLTNETGQNVFSIPISYVGESQKTITLPKEIVQGIYYIRIENANYRWNKKIVIL